MSSNTQKLRVIRSRTDHDMLILVERELDNGFALLDVAATPNSALFAQAAKIYQTVTTLFSKISGLSLGDRLRVEVRLRELRSRLDQVPAFAKVDQYPLSVAS